MNAELYRLHNKIYCLWRFAKCLISGPSEMIVWRSPEWFECGNLNPISVKSTRW